jgi:molybdate transport system substrate-binding protein
MGRMIARLVALAAFIAVQVIWATWAGGVEIKVFSTIGVKGALEELIPAFEKSSGHKLNVTWSTATLLAKRVESGEQADALILIKGNVESLLKQGKVVPGTEQVFGQSIFAVGVKTGAPKPDISTPETFKQSLLAAKGISYSDPASGGASGVYIAKQIDKMGIAEQLKGKIKFPPSGGFSGALLVSGHVDIAIQSKPELLSISGVEVVGPLPGDMAFTVVYAAGVQSGAAQAEAAKAFINFLKSPEAQAVFTAKGYDPV